MANKKKSDKRRFPHLSGHAGQDKGGCIDQANLLAFAGLHNALGAVFARPESPKSPKRRAADARTNSQRASQLENQSNKSKAPSSLTISQTQQVSGTGSAH
jgi:hypothetical protein